MNAAVEFVDVDILFAPEGRSGRRLKSDALAALDAGASRADIQKRFGVILGVAGASLSVASGEISVLMGLSGSGKSTLLRAANGLNAVTRGQVWIQDGDSRIDVAHCSEAELRHLRRRRVAMVFQQFGLLPWRTVRDNVGLGLELRGESVAERQRIVAEKLELVGLSQWADRHVGELSGGMQQRVGLARAFATDADVLLMDEPFSALDPLIRGKLQNELLELQARVKKTILFVSHDLDEALKLGDRISILQNGRIIQTGTAENIVLHPADDYVCEFVRHMNPLTVLTSEMVMKNQSSLDRDGAHLYLDAPRRYRVVAEGVPSEVHIDGTPQSLHPIADEASLPQGPGMAMVPTGVSLQSIIRLHQHTGHPVLVVQDRRVLGVCGPTEILKALSGESRNPGP